MVKKLKVNAPKYACFGHVNFPYDTGGWDDAELGVLTVRLLAISMFADKIDMNLEKEGEPQIISFDDVLICTDKHEKPEDAFNYISKVQNGITASYLMGHINWVGSAKADVPVFWSATTKDLTEHGKVLYDKFLLEHASSDILVVTSLCRSSETIKNLMEETKSLGLPKVVPLLN